MNFDANYGHEFKVADETHETEKQIEKFKESEHQSIGTSPEMIRERNDIARQLYICNYARPQWDVDILIRNGISMITIDTDISKKTFPGFDKFFGIKKETGKLDKDTPIKQMFMVKAIKA